MVDIKKKKKGQCHLVASSLSFNTILSKELYLHLYSESVLGS